MQRCIPPDFWLNVHKEFCDIDARHRAEMVAINRSLHLKEKKSFMKHMSYCGAVRVPDDFPNEFVSYTDEKTGQRFIDPMNSLYCDVFKAVWPNVTFISNPETVGDLIEAILGWAWVMKDLGIALGPEGEDFVQFLEQACLSEYTLRTWYGKGA